MSEFYPVPCALCGQGIKRTNKAGRPPKQHKDGCPTDEKRQADVAVAPEAAADIQDEAQVDPDIKAVEEFLTKAPAPRRRHLPDFNPERIGIVARMVKHDDVLWVGRDKQYRVNGDAELTTSREHVWVNLIGHPNKGLKIIESGTVYIVPRKR